MKTWLSFVPAAALLAGCVPAASTTAPSASGATLLQRYTACLTAARASSSAEAALTRCRPELESTLARRQVPPQRRAAMVESIEVDGRVLLGLTDDPAADAAPNRLAWAFCVTVRSVELDDEVSPPARIAVDVERACRPYATASGSAERDLATQVVQRARAGQW